VDDSETTSVCRCSSVERQCRSVRQKQAVLNGVLCFLGLFKFLVCLFFSSFICLSLSVVFCVCVFYYFILGVCARVSTLSLSFPRFSREEVSLFFFARKKKYPIFLYYIKKKTSE
jgi:hypothetical protein